MFKFLLQSCTRRRFVFQIPFWLITLTLYGQQKPPPQPTGSVTYNQSFGSGLDKQAILIFNQDESLYYFQRKNRKKASLEELFIDNGDNSVEITLDVADQEGICFYLNRSQSQLVSRMFNVFTNEHILLKEPSPEIKWEITAEVRLIGRYESQKAVGSFRGREWEAWFTPEIPVGLGPWKLHGLPGLILEASDNEKKYHFELVEINMPTDNQTSVVAPQKGRVIEGWGNYVTFLENSFRKWSKAIVSRGPGMAVEPMYSEGIEVIE